MIDAKQAMTSGWAPLIPAPWKTDIKAPLTLAKGSLKETARKMAIEIAVDEKSPATGKFSVRWGKHELSAPVKFHFDAGAKDAAGKK